MSNSGTGAAPAAPGTLADRPPARADGIELIGEMPGSGYRVPPALARRADGQTVQLTPLLYLLLSAIDGESDTEALAAAVSQAYGKQVSADNVEHLLEEQLRQRGLVTLADGSQPGLERSNPLLGLRMKVSVTDPERTRRLTAPFAQLFRPFLVLPVVVAFALITWWVLVEKGLASATYEAFSSPGLLLALIVITIVSAGWHEFGHAAAARYGGATPGVMGAGVYLIWPAFYTDVTDSYRLGRGGRIRTDLGGLYFNALIVVATLGVWWVSSADAVLLLVAGQILQMLRQLLPLVRFDGYHVLADVTGIPDLFHWIGPVLKSALPWRWKDPEPRRLKPWARVVITAWVLAVVPLLLLALGAMVLALPRIAATAWASAGQQQDLASVAWADGDLIGSVARWLGMVIVVLPILAMAILLGRLVRQIVRGTWRRTEGRPARRATAVVTGLAIVAGLAWVWWPNADTYDPIRPWERGSLRDAVAVARPAVGFDVGSSGRASMAWSNDQERPTRDKPQLAMVLVPRGDIAGSAVKPGSQGSTADTTSDTVAVEQPWIFPFNQPLAPDEGDNQAMAVNTTDGTTQYDVAFALVWVEEGEVADNVNEAYALASCKDCSAVSVAFQVVLVQGQTNAAVPQNISVAVNSGCVNCLTYSLAVQLFVTLEGVPDDATLKELDALWGQIAAYGETIGEQPLGSIQAQLTDFEQQILALVNPQGQQNPAPGGESPSPTPVGTTSPSSSPSSSPSDGPTSVAPTGSPTGSPTSGSSPTGTPTPSSTPSTSPSPSPTTSSSPSPSTSPTPAPTPTPTSG